MGAGHIWEGDHRLQRPPLEQLWLWPGHTARGFLLLFHYTQGFYCLPANVSTRRRQAEGEETHDRAKRESTPGSGLVFRAPSAP